MAEWCMVFITLHLGNVKFQSKQSLTIRFNDQKHNWIIYNKMKVRDCHSGKLIKIGYENRKNLK